MKYYNTSFTAYGFDNTKSAISTGNVYTNTNVTLGEHFCNLRKGLYAHAERSLKEGFPTSTMYTIVITIFDTNLQKTTFINIKKNILDIFKNYERINNEKCKEI